MLNMFTLDSFSDCHSLSHAVMGVTVYTFCLITKHFKELEVVDKTFYTGAPNKFSGLKVCPWTA